LIEAYVARPGHEQEMPMFRRMVLAGLAAASLLMALPAAAQMPDLKGRSIIAITENAYYPLNFADPANGQGIGLEYDMFNEIAKRLNAKVEWKLLAWDATIQAVRDGQGDVAMNGISITDERKQQVDYSDPYLVAEQFMLVRADESRFADAAAFKADAKLLVGAQTGTTNFYVSVRELLGGDDKSPRLKLFETFGQSVQALKNGDVDTVLMDKAGAGGVMSAQANAFKLTGPGMGKDEFGIIMKKGSDLAAPVNAALAAMKADGTMAKLETKWFYEYANKK
jgi:polar amino acid transport system substrate-binding protein